MTQITHPKYEGDNVMYRPNSPIKKQHVASCAMSQSSKGYGRRILYSGLALDTQRDAVVKGQNIQKVCSLYDTVYRLIYLNRTSVHIKPSLVFGMLPKEGL